MRSISSGTWIGLKNSANEKQVFTIVAFDQRGSYQKMLSADVQYEEAVQIKLDVVEILSPFTSAFLLDPEYGIKPALQMHRNSGLLMAVEKSGYTGDSTYRRTEMYPTWNVEAIKHFGANAVKILVYYNPDAGELADEIDTLCRDIASQCEEQDIAFFLEPVIYSLDANIAKNSPEFAQERPRLVKETANRLEKVGAHVLKLEFPMDANFNDNDRDWQKACTEVSDSISIPWVLLSAGVNFDVFAKQVRVACQNGASGFLGGRAIWKESISMPRQERIEFLKQTGIARVEQLSALTKDYAKPWTQFFETAPTPENWFKEYADNRFNVS